MSTLTASHGLTLSEIGLKLIKAYEGYRPVDRTLVTGQRVVGYGHRLYDDRPMRLSKADAEKLLKQDLQAFEDMVNENVHAPLTQGQFDALVSFAYNIGPKAFLESDTVRALNNGRPLDAANGLDVWRKSTIDGKTYVVDALMRRRTAEKALFLRTSGVARPAPAADLPPVKDEALAILSTEDALPVFSQSDANGLVAKVSIDRESKIAQTESYGRRRDDNPIGTLLLSELAEERDEVDAPVDLVSDTDLISSQDDILDAANVSIDQFDDATDVNLDIEFIDNDLANEEQGESEADTMPRSIIAEAAADISDRLDALIESTEQEDASLGEDWPDALVSIPEPPKSNLVAFPQSRLVAPEVEDGFVILPDNFDAPSSASSEETSFIDSEETDEIEESSILTEADVDVFIDNLVEDDALRLTTDENSAARYVDYDAPEPVIETQASSGYWAIICLGFLILFVALGAYLFNITDALGEWGPSILLSGVIAGSVMVLAGVYYAIKNAFNIR